RPWAWTAPTRSIPSDLVLRKPLASAHVGQVPGKPHRVWLPGKPRPWLADNPMLWKELYVERGLGFDQLLGATAPVGQAVGALVVMTYALLGLFCFTLIPASMGSDFRGAINVTTRVVGTVLLCFMAVGIALRAAGSLSSERERQTLDSLLTTPLENLAILGA